MKPSKESAVLIRRMCAAVMAEPELLDQERFPETPACDTPSCGAGWAIYCDDPAGYETKAKGFCEAFNSFWPEKRDRLVWVRAACTALKIPLTSFAEVHLFGYAHCWPSPFAEDYNIARGYKAHAEVFTARWEHYIRTGR